MRGLSLVHRVWRGWQPSATARCRVNFPHHSKGAWPADNVSSPRAQHVQLCCLGKEKHTAVPLNRPSRSLPQFGHPPYSSANLLFVHLSPRRLPKTSQVAGEVTPPDIRSIPPNSPSPCESNGPGRCLCQSNTPRHGTPLWALHQLSRCLYVCCDTTCLASQLMPVRLLTPPVLSHSPDHPTESVVLTITCSPFSFTAIALSLGDSCNSPDCHCP